MTSDAMTQKIASNISRLDRGKVPVVLSIISKDKEGLATFIKDKLATP
ncbi:MAG: hypothetical protein WCQ41_00810 [Bacillota bacterium]